MSDFDYMLRLGVEKLALTKTELVSAAARTNTEPTEAQKDSGNYRKGRAAWKGLELVIENPKGSVRSGKSKDGTTWSTTMQDHYGYFGSTKSKADGDAVDFFLADEHLDSEIVFIVNQNKADGTFDEHKVVLGCHNVDDAKKTYLRNYSKGWTGLGSIKAMTLDEFKTWVKSAPAKAASANDLATGCDAGGQIPERRRGRLLTVQIQGHYTPQLYFVKRAEDDDQPFTIAVDLDGTIAKKEEPFNPETIGEPIEDAIDYVRQFKKAGARIIIFTVRGDTAMVEKWLDDNDVPYDFVNHNPDQPEDASGKVIADVYWDDRAYNAEDPHEHGPGILRRITEDEGDLDQASGPVMMVQRTTTTIMIHPHAVLDGLQEQHHGDDG